MTTIRLVGIVEGHGEEASLPVLLRRLGLSLGSNLWIDVVDVIRRPRQRIVQPGQIEAAVQLAATMLDEPGGVLIVLDSDDDCPAQLGPQLLGRARSARPDLPVAVVLAKRMLEAWFLAAADSLRGHRGLSPSLQAPPDPEGVANPKRWLSDHMPRNQPYSSTLHQASFAQTIDLERARSAPSFDKLCRDVADLLGTLRTTPDRWTQS